MKLPAISQPSQRANPFKNTISPMKRKLLLNSGTHTTRSYGSLKKPIIRQFSDLPYIDLTEIRTALKMFKKEFPAQYYNPK